MQLQEILDFIDRSMSEGGKKPFLHDQDQVKKIFSQALKISEEVGELNSEVLGNQGFVKEENLHRYTPESLMDEFADVILSTIRLARFMDIDISMALKNKMKKIKNR